jgi:FkbM family methyltransferase
VEGSATTFTQALIARLSRAALDEQSHNRDESRFGKKTWRSRLYTVARQAAKSIGFGPYRWVHRVNPRALQKWGAVFPELEWMYRRFADDESRRTLVDVIAYRLMGDRSVKLPLNTSQYWARRKELDRLRRPGDAIDFGFMGWRLDRFDLRAIGYPIDLHSRVPNILAQFELQQYACPRLGVRAEAGFTVVDGGGCFGDTALYFAHRVGEAGRVYSFEFVESNLDLFRRNLSLNPALAARIEICPHPLWSTSDVPLYVVDRGPASKVLPEAPVGTASARVTTLSVDELVARRSLARVDLIKMDIEGAEFESLRGAEQTIRRFRPQLAICVYHSPEDFVRLARLIDSFEPAYRFALGHFTIHAEETVLFAKVDAAPAAPVAEAVTA